MKPLNHRSPWLSIWTKPRATIAQIVADNPNRSLWLLAAIYGFSSLLNLFQSSSLGVQIGIFPILLIAAIFSPLWGYISFTVWSWVVSWTGRWFKGRGAFPAIRAAYAWSCVPLSINVFLWFVMAFLFGRPLFMNFPEGSLLPQSYITLLFLILMVKVILAIWSLVIYLNALAEVQGYSVLRAIGNVLVAGILLGLAMMVFWSLSFYLLGGGHPVHHPAMTSFQLWNDGTYLETLRRGQ